MRKALQITGQVLFYIFVIYSIAYLASEAISPSKTMAFFGYKSFIVVTQSMEPDINRGDWIVVIKSKPEQLEIGEAITFYTYLRLIDDYDYVTHYLVDIDVNQDNEKVYITQGVNQPIDRWTDENGDPKDILYEDIVGRVFIVIPFLGNIVFALRNPLMLGLVIVNIIIIVVLIKYIKSMKKDVKNELE